MKLKPFAWAALLMALVAVAWIGWRRTAGVRERRTMVAPAGPSAERAVPEIQPRAGGEAAMEDADAREAAPTREAAPPPEPPVAAPSTGPVQVIVNGQAEYLKRVAALDTLPGVLPDADSQALRAYLVQPGPNDSTPGEHAFKNRLLNLLGSMDPPPAWLGSTLVEMYRDRRQHVVLRDYAVQHLAEYFEQLEAGGPDDARARGMVEAILWEALSETDTSIAGTALLALERLSQRRPELDQDRIAAAAFRLASDGGTGELARLTAFQVCGEMGVKEIVPRLVQAIQREQSTALKISAVAALGMLGNAETKPLLRDLINGVDPRLKAPAERALSRIEQREQEANARRVESEKRN